MRLADVLAHCGVRNAVQAGRHVCFRGPKHELPQGALLACAGIRRCTACGPRSILPRQHPSQQARNARNSFKHCLMSHLGLKKP